jgi:hypothetical protein
MTSAFRRPCFSYERGAFDATSHKFHLDTTISGQGNSILWDTSSKEDVVNSIYRNSLGEDVACTRICASFLQMDHVQPFSYYISTVGTYDTESLSRFCYSHALR